MLAPMRASCLRSPDRGRASLARLGGALLVLTTMAAVTAAHADEQLVLMREPTPYTDVIDAAEQHDRFDMNAHLGYVRSIDRGEIQREHTSNGERKRSTVAN